MTKLRDGVNMDIGSAVFAMREGKRVRRAGWNGKGMWLQFVHEWRIDAPPGHGVRLLPWVGMKTADNGFVPWLCSQTDLLATDWELVE